MITVSTPIKDAALSPYLEQRANVHQLVLRKLFVAVYIKKENPNQAYNRLAAQFGIFAVEINSLRKETEAIYRSWKEGLEWRIGQQETRIQNLAAKLDKTPWGAKAHQWKRKLHRYQAKLAAWQAELTAGVPRLCFGTRKLFYAQFHLKANGYDHHAHWKQDWQAARGNAFYLAGRARERSGNDACILQVLQVSNAGLEGLLNLRKKNDEITGCRAKVGDYLAIPVRFAHNHAYILRALEDQRPITYRFLRDGVHWKVQAIVDTPHVPIVTDVKNGSLGVDQNPLCIAACSLKPDGNAEDHYLYKLTQGHRSATQAEHELAQVVCALVDLAVVTHRPIVIEKLNFKQLQRELKGRGLNRILSRFKYSLFQKLLYSRAAKHGVEIIEVNPAYSSLIGWLKFGYGYGLNPHQAAAVAIGRRVIRPNGKRFSERIRMRITPGHPAASHLATDASPKPAGNRAEHVWTGWRRLRKLLASKPSPPSGVAVGERSAVSRQEAEQQGVTPYPGAQGNKGSGDGGLLGGVKNHPSVNRRGTVYAPA